MTEPVPAPPAEASKDARTWGMLCHLSAFSAVFTGVGSVLGPLVVWLLKRNDYPFVEDQGKESLNFQITMFICEVICIALFIFVIGYLLLVLVGLFDLVMVIIAATHANKGERYRYPVAIRFVK